MKMECRPGDVFALSTTCTAFAKIRFTRITLFGLAIRPYTLTGYGNMQRIGGGGVQVIETQIDHISLLISFPAVPCQSSPYLFLSILRICLGVVDIAVQVTAISVKCAQSREQYTHHQICDFHTFLDTMATLNERASVIENHHRIDDGGGRGPTRRSEAFWSPKIGNSHCGHGYAGLGCALNQTLATRD
jgi:hypothetical protein